MAVAAIPMTSALAFCRDCFGPIEWAEDQPKPSRCGGCNSPRVLAHSELSSLTIAHIDCDAFYAAIEKRDNPDLLNKPVIIGGGKRGVVSTACYIARIFGIRSAMPMFKALKACPDAVVIKPNMAKYVEAGQAVRTLMKDVTPSVEPISIDEAFLDLTGTERLHKRSAAETLARLAARIQTEIGISVSIGLSHNKFLAKLSSDFEKPKGFSVIGRTETQEVLAPLPINKIWGVGKAFETRLRKDGLHRIGQLQVQDETEFMKRYGDMGRRLIRLSVGQDARRVVPRNRAKSISGETTFHEDITSGADLIRKLWPLCERVSARAKKSRKVGQTVTLKLKTSDFKLRTRSRTLIHATQMAEILFREGKDLLLPEVDGTPFRLVGIGLTGLSEQDGSNDADLFDHDVAQIKATENVIDQVREKFGDMSIQKGRAIRRNRDP